MSEDILPQKSYHTHFALLLLIGLVAIGLALFIAGWTTGYLRPKESIALVTWNQDPYWDMVISGAQAAAKSRNVDLIVVRSEPDENAQSQHVRDLLAQGVKGIAISPKNPAGQADLLTQVADKAVLVTFDSDAQIPHRKGFVGSDNYAAGQLCAEEVRSAIPNGGNVIISVGSVDMINGRDRRQGLIDNLLDRRPKEDRPADSTDAELKGNHYAIVATVLDGGDADKARSGVADAIAAHPNVNCIVGLFGYSAPAIVKAVQQAGKSGQIKVIGFDELDATQAGVADGTIFSSIIQDEYRCGGAAVDLLADALRGDDVNAPKGPRFIALNLQVMKADNLAELRTEKLIHIPK